MALNFNKLTKQVKKTTSKALEEGNKIIDGGSKILETGVKNIIANKNTVDISVITKEGALKIICLLMSVDKQIKDEELDQYKSIAYEIDNNYNHKLLSDIQKDIAKFDENDYFDDLLDLTKDILNESLLCSGGDISVKLLLWNLFVVAYSDNDINEDEMRLIRYIARQAKIDKSIILDYENTIKTLQAIENEKEMLKTSDKSFHLVDSKLKDLDKRKKNIMENVMILINE